MRYPTIVHYMLEDGACVAVVTGLPCCTAHGETPEEALRAAPAAQEGRLEVVPDGERPIPEPSRPVTAQHDDDPVQRRVPDRRGAERDASQAQHDGGGMTGAWPVGHDGGRDGAAGGHTMGQTT